MGRLLALPRRFGLGGKSAASPALRQLGIDSIAKAPICVAFVLHAPDVFGRELKGPILVAMPFARASTHLSDACAIKDRHSGRFEGLVQHEGVPLDPWIGANLVTAEPTGLEGWPRSESASFSPLTK